QRSKKPRYDVTCECSYFASSSTTVTDMDTTMAGDFPPSLYMEGERDRVCPLVDAMPRHIQYQSRKTRRLAILLRRLRGGVIVAAFLILIYSRCDKTIKKNLTSHVSDFTTDPLGPKLLSPELISVRRCFHPPAQAYEPPIWAIRAICQRWRLSSRICSLRRRSRVSHCGGRGRRRYRNLRTGTICIKASVDRARSEHRILPVDIIDVTKVGSHQACEGVQRGRTRPHRQRSKWNEGAVIR